MPKINLAAAQEAIEAKYEDLEVDVLTSEGEETVAFMPVLRLPKARRKAIGEALDIPTRAKADDGTDLYDIYKDVFRLSERTEGDFAKLDAFVGDNPAMWEHLFEAYIKGTEAGEA